MPQQLIAVWMILMIATIASWHSDAVVSGAWISTLVLVVAFFKARLVLVHFMDLRQATPLLRFIANVWVVSACACLVVLSWMTSSPFFSL